MIFVNEGEFKQAQPNDDLVHAGINSCVSVTVAYPNGERIGGHASLAPGGGQLGLQGILLGIMMSAALRNMVGATGVYVVGDLGSWPGQPGWPATGANGLAAALGLPGVPVWSRDTQVLNGNHATTVNAIFGQHPGRMLIVERTHDQHQLVNTTW